MCTLFSRKSRDEILFVIPTDDFATVAEPGAARVLPAPHRDGGSAAPTGHTALQSSRDSRSSSTGAVIQTHADDSANGENAGQLQTENAALFKTYCFLQDVLGPMECMFGSIFKKLW